MSGRNKVWRYAAIGLVLVATPFGAFAVPLPRPNPQSVAMQAPAIATPSAAKELATQQNIPVVLSARLGEHPDKTRFVVELSDAVEVRVFTLADPSRVVIDLPEVLWRVNANDRPSGKGAVKRYRYGLFRKGNSRFVVDLVRPVRVSEPQLLPPQGGHGFRYIFDFFPASEREFLANAGWPKMQITAPAPSPPPPPLADMRVIVVDAGHGGVDPGAHGEGGLQEKDIVLAVAIYLRDALEADSRYKVYLTRDSDAYIPLRERVNIARAAHADLFISLHADANDHRGIRGASIYTLSEEASDREAAKLAERENMSDVIAGVDLAAESGPVASILIDLAQRDTMNRSVRFSQVALGRLSQMTLLQNSSPHRSAGFAVLKAPDLPAVLIELGYLSSLEDEAVMRTERWRKGVAEALAAAVNKYFARETAATPKGPAVP
ncbi:MAG: N-acetylmuramoyl-L-alanine amidase [Alphaproteobacteria bacterium]